MDEQKCQRVSRSGTLELSSCSSELTFTFLIKVEIFVPAIPCILVVDDTTDVTECRIEQSDLIDVTDDTVLWRTVDNHVPGRRADVFEAGGGSTQLLDPLKRDTDWVVPQNR